MKVSIVCCNGWLRLQWKPQGMTRQFLYLGLRDSAIARARAKEVASRIEIDLIAGNYDSSLSKYRIGERRVDRLSASELIRLYYDSRTTAAPTTRDKYRILADQVEEILGNTPADSIDSKKAAKFVSYLKDRQQLSTIRSRLANLSAVWRWGEANKGIKSNPWIDACQSVIVPPKQRPRPFTVKEIEDIVRAFQTEPSLQPYLGYVEFLLSTGCRPAEAIGLRWRHLSENCRSAWIGETIVRGRAASTKTGKDRDINLPPRLAKKLELRRGEPDDLVFPSPRGLPIDDKNFCRRIWKKALTIAGVFYRRPYTTRSTLISHWLERGENPIVIAEFTGHDVKTLYEFYAGSIRTTSPPDLFSDLDDLPDN